MMESNTEIYTVCGVDAIPAQRCKPFTLLRLEGGRAAPWQIIILRWGRKFFGYVNRCPHQGSPLNFEHNQFFDPSRRFLMCGRHGAQFDVKTGACIEGPCRAQGLTPLRLIIDNGDICIAGVTLVEQGSEQDIDPDETIEIMIHPD